MNLPFTIDQFLSVLEQYNLSVWPMQYVLNLLGLTAIMLCVRRFPFSNKLISAIPAFLWLWIACGRRLGVTLILFRDWKVHVSEAGRTV